jgi:hypothetical protein
LTLQNHKSLLGRSETFGSENANFMNESIPPITGAPQPKTSGLAIWSLVLGILSLVCFSILTGIPGVICGHMAFSRIKRSAGALTGQGLAIAGLVTGYLGIAWAVVMIPLMLAIAIPNFVKARETSMANACINNLRQIDAAKQEWALENGKKGDAVPTVQDLTPYIRNGVYTVPDRKPYTSNGVLPTCPAGGTYTIGAVSNSPVCTIPGHICEGCRPNQ